MCSVVVLHCVHCAAMGPNSAGRPLPAYAGHATELFDDVIEPDAVGISLDPGVDTKAHRVLRELAQVGDTTMRVRVSTITAKDEDSGPRYLMRVHHPPAADRPAHPFGDAMELVVDKSEPSSGILGVARRADHRQDVRRVRPRVRPPRRRPRDPLPIRRRHPGRGSRPSPTPPPSAVCSSSGSTVKAWRSGAPACRSGSPGRTTNRRSPTGALRTTRSPSSSRGSSWGWSRR